jgi:hypothetical protein
VSSQIDGHERISMNDKECPFKVGETVIYQPTKRGRGLIIMTALAALKAGGSYKIARIDRGNYVVIEGFENAAGGGLYWTEFRPGA